MGNDRKIPKIIRRDTVNDMQGAMSAESGFSRSQMGSDFRVLVPQLAGNTSAILEEKD